MQQVQRQYAPPTRAALRHRDLKWHVAENSEMRIRAYNVNGERIGVAGVGEGEDRFTFPAKLRLQTILGFDHWIKQAQPGAAKWYLPMGDWRPRAIILENGTIASPDDPIAIGGGTVTIINTEMDTTMGEDTKMPSLAEVKTPQTPSEANSGNSSIAPIRIYEREILIATPSDEDTESNETEEQAEELGERYWTQEAPALGRNGSEYGRG